MPRPLNAYELDVQSRIRALMAAVEKLRQAPRVFDQDTTGYDALQSILVDTPAYCADALTALNALPAEEEAAEDARKADAAKWEEV